MKTASLQAGEDLAARGATHPRVTLNDIKNNVGLTYFVNAYNIVEEASTAEEEKLQESLKVLTICIIVLRNGYTIIGKSAPAVPENFNAEKGKEFAYEDALRQAWPLMGYELRERLYRDTADFETLVGEGEPSLDDVGDARYAGDDGDDGYVMDGDKVAEAVEPNSPAIPDDEELEGLSDQPIKDLALAHGFDYVDRHDAIGKLKVRRHAISGQPNG